MNATSREPLRRDVIVQMSLGSAMAVLVACGGATTPAEKGTELAQLRCDCDRDTAAKPCGEELWARTQQTAAAFEADPEQIDAFYTAYKTQLGACSGAREARLPRDWNNYKRLMSATTKGARGKQPADAAQRERLQGTGGEQMVRMLEDMLAGYEQLGSKDPATTARIEAEKAKVKDMIASVQRAGAAPSDDLKKQMVVLRRTFLQIQGNTKPSSDDRSQQAPPGTSKPAN